MIKTNNMVEKSELVVKFETLSNELSATKKELVIEFKEKLRDLFEKNKCVENINISLNNHEFNDGSATRFSLYYEDLTLTDENDEEYDGYENKENKSINQIRDSFIELFSIYDKVDIYEYLFGEEYANVSLNLNSKILK